MENNKVLLCVLTSKGRGVLLESKAVDGKTHNVLGVNLGHYLVGHINIYTGV